MNEKSFWYIVCNSSELKPNHVLSRCVLDEWLVIFRDENGEAKIFRDLCVHRNSQLSRGRVRDGKLQCGYHGWTFNGNGEVVWIPSEGSDCKSRFTNRCLKVYEVKEKDDYVYVRLDNEISEMIPFKMPCYKEEGYSSIRLINRFFNNVTNCAENFVDVPHTVFVHPLIFRNLKKQKFKAQIKRENGSVIVEYQNETSNFGIFSWFLNSSGSEIQHRDEFHMPNITSVHYHFGGKKHFIITSQSVPVSSDETLVYTDLTYNYGLWNRFAQPIIRWQGQKIIDQDIEILGNQMKMIKKYGQKFMNSPADYIHVFIESIRESIQKESDPRSLSPKSMEVDFWV